MNLRYKYSQIYLILSTILINNINTFSQINGISAKSISLGSAGTAYSSGLESVSINPANLAHFDEYGLSVSILPQVYAVFDNNIFDLAIYNKYFTGIEDGTGKRIPKKLTDQDKQYLLDLFPSDGKGEVIVNPEVTIFSIAYTSDKISGGIAFTIKEKGFGNIGLPKDAFQLLLYGNSLNSQYNFDNVNVYGSWLREYSLTYGAKLYTQKETKIRAGVSIKYLYGNAFLKINSAGSNFVTTDTSIRGKINLHYFLSQSDFLKEDKTFKPFGKPAGSGFAFDVGFNLSWNNGLTFGISMNDIGFIQWERNNETIDIDTLSEIIEITDEDQYKPFEDIIEHHRIKNAEPRTIRIPISFHVGVMLELHKMAYFKDNDLFPLVVTSDFHYHSNTELGEKKLFLYSFGLEAKFIKWLPLRFGGSLGSMPFAFSFGFGINTKSFDLDLGVGNFFALFDESKTHKVAFAFGTLFKF